MYNRLKCAIKFLVTEEVSTAESNQRQTEVSKDNTVTFQGVWMVCEFLGKLEICS
jgi:hypothetical protein